MPKGGIKGNRGRADPKIRSENMDLLLVADREMAANNPDSPPVNKKNIKLMASEKGEAIARNLIRALPIPSLWVVPVHQPQASSIVHQTWTGNSFHT